MKNSNNPNNVLWQISLMVLEKKDYTILPHQTLKSKWVIVIALHLLSLVIEWWLFKF
jgi:hypothetical protein